MEIESLLLIMIILLNPITVLGAYAIVSMIIRKIEVEKSKRYVQEIMNNNELSSYDKGGKLLAECNLLHYFKDAKYEDELCKLTNDFLKANNLKLKDYL